MQIEKNNQFNFVFSAKGTEYKISIIAETEEEALEKVREQLAMIILEINENLESKKKK